MAIAFKKPFTPETQALKDSVDLSDKASEEIPCQQCDAVYLLIYPKPSTPEQIHRYTQAVHQGMANCDHHPSYMEMPF